MKVVYSFVEAAMDALNELAIEKPFFLEIIRLSAAESNIFSVVSKYHVEDKLADGVIVIGNFRKENVADQGIECLNAYFMESTIEGRNKLESATLILFSKSDEKLKLTLSIALFRITPFLFPQRKGY